MVKKMMTPKDAKAIDLNDLQPKSSFDKSTKHIKAKGICVVLDEDMKKTDLEEVMKAIALIRGVAVVKYIDVDAFHDYPNRTRARIELRKQLGKILEL